MVVLLQNVMVACKIAAAEKAMAWGHREHRFFPY